MGFGLVFLLVLSLGVFDVCEGKGKGYEEAVNCKRLECAPYEVVHSQKDYEIRSYTTSMWISTPPLNSSSYKDAVGRGFNMWKSHSVFLFLFYFILINFFFWIL